MQIQILTIDLKLVSIKNSLHLLTSQGFPYVRSTTEIEIHPFLTVNDQRFL